MRVATWFSSLLFAAVVLAADPPTTLQIETTFMPEDCPAKATKGDSIQVHYVRDSVLRSHTATHPARRLARSSPQAPSLTPGLLFSLAVSPSSQRAKQPGPWLTPPADTYARSHTLPRYF
jgi:hypothetical protein